VFRIPRSWGGRQKSQRLIRAGSAGSCSNETAADQRRDLFAPQRQTGLRALRRISSDCYFAAVERRIDLPRAVRPQHGRRIFHSFRCWSSSISRSSAKLAVELQRYDHYRLAAAIKSFVADIGKGGAVRWATYRHTTGIRPDDRLDPRCAIDTPDV